MDNFKYLDLLFDGKDMNATSTPTPLGKLSLGKKGRLMRMNEEDKKKEYY